MASIIVIMQNLSVIHLLCIRRLFRLSQEAESDALSLQLSLINVSEHKSLKLFSYTNSNLNLNICWLVSACCSAVAHHLHYNETFGTTWGSSISLPPADQNQPSPLCLSVNAVILFCPLIKLITEDLSYFFIPNKTSVKKLLHVT